MVHGTFLVFLRFYCACFFFFFFLLVFLAFGGVVFTLDVFFGFFFLACPPLSSFRRGLEVGGSLFICGDVGRSWEGGERLD